jgi:hypothetical protein
VELTCEKYKEKLKNGEAVCGHPEEYCKFREACIINFMTRELDREKRQTREGSAAADGSKQVPVNNEE